MMKFDISDWTRRHNLLMKELYAAVGAGYKLAGLKEIEDKKYRLLSIQQLIKEALRVAGVEKVGFLSDTRKRPMTDIRCIVCYEARIRGYSLHEIATTIKRDHSTVLYYLNRYEGYKMDEKFDKLAILIQDALKQSNF